MVTPNVWGQGQLFAFSGLDGSSLSGDDFVGTLSGDKIGIRFHTKVIRELAVVNVAHLKPEFETVASDLIRIRTGAGPVTVIYADTHTIVGEVAGCAEIVVSPEGRYAVREKDGIELHDTRDGEFTALLRDNGRFAFAYGATEEAAIQKAQKGISLDLEKLLQKKLSFFQKYHLDAAHPYARLYAKCVSVMKSQLYSPEGRFQRMWSTPDRLPHKKLWLWDSVFHAIGHRNLNPQLAEDLILAVLDCQTEEGFIPHMASAWDISSITQPPVIAWGAWLVYQKTGNRAFLKTVWDANRKFLLWCSRCRRDTDQELYTWLTDSDVNCRCDESGMDNSPRFDAHTRLQAIDFSCFMANDTRFMAKIAAELDDREGEAWFANWHKQIREDINRKLWDEKDCFYYDYDLKNECFHKVSSVASFLPLFAGVCTPEQAKALAEHLQDPETFGTPYPIPSISRKDPTYGSDMWRGPVWINYNYMIIMGLREYGCSALGDEIREKTLRMLHQWYIRKGTIFEFYDSEDQRAPNELNRKGPCFEPYHFGVRCQSIRDYGWSCTLCLDMLHGEENRTVW